jgi:hypothetical protein
MRYERSTKIDLGGKRLIVEKFKMLARATSLEGIVFTSKSFKDDFFAAYDSFTRSSSIGNRASALYIPVQGCAYVIANFTVLEEPQQEVNVSNAFKL